MKKKSARAQRPSKLDNLAQAIARDYAHQNSAVIHSKRRVLQCEMDEAEVAILNLGCALQAAREKRARIDAMLRGLASVIEKR